MERPLSGLVCLALVAGCYRLEKDRIPGPFDCVDADADGYGDGRDCLGPDCSAADPSAHDCSCVEGEESHGCPCPAFEVTGCFDGPAGASNVGICVSGLRRCLDSGFWGECEEQVLPVDETCNQIDDDCDGEVDEGIVHACAACQSGCTVEGFGAGRLPFTADGPGLTVTAEGALTLTGESIAPRLAWIPNTLEGTVSKVDTRDRTELARYRTGPRGAASFLQGSEGDVPSAVTVTPIGDALVANRAPGDVPTLTRIFASACPAGADGIVTTSAGHDVLPWGDDECVAWHTAVGPSSSTGRAVVLEIRRELDGGLHEYAWLAAGLRLYEVDAEAGEETGTIVELDRRASSAVIDPDGIVWLAVTGEHDLVRVDPVTLFTEIVPLPDGESAHDVAVDPRGDVWTAGSRVMRYRPRADTWELADAAPTTGPIVADTRGVAWTIDESGEVQRVDDGPGFLDTRTISTGVGGIGIAVDHDGMVWAIAGRDAGLVTVLDPDNPELGAETCCDFLASSHPRGDLTGAPRFADLAPVAWTGRLETTTPNDCPVSWGLLDVQGDIGDGVRIVAEVRAAGTLEELERTEWLRVSEAPPDSWPEDVAPTMIAAGQGGPILDVRLTIDPVVRDELPVIDAVTIERTELCF